MTGLLKFLLIVICVLWVIRMVARLVLPMLFQRVVNKAQQQAGRRTEYYQSAEQTSRKATGKISIDYIPPQDKEARAADRAGDFIEFEELK